MKKIFHDNLFEYDDDGTLQFFPIDSSHAELICKNLISEKNILLEQQNEHEKNLSKTPQEDESKQSKILRNLIELQLTINSISEKIKALKIWYDSNDMPFPYTESYIEKFNWTGEISLLAYDLIFRFEQDDLKHLDDEMEAFKFGANHYTWKGKKIIPEQLHNNYHKSKSIHKYDKLEEKASSTKY